MKSQRKGCKGRGKKQSRRIKYGGTKNGYKLLENIDYEFPTNHSYNSDEFFDVDLNNTPNEEKKVLNKNYFYFGGVIVVVTALIVGIAVPMSKNK